MRWAIAAVFSLLSACGSKTGLLVEPGAPDATPADALLLDAPAPDGGFDTFPCRWSYEGDVLVATSIEPYGRIRGTVHPSGPTALLVAERGPETADVARVDVRAMPETAWVRTAAPADQAYATPAGFAMLRNGLCTLEKWSFDGAPTGTIELGSWNCRASSGYDGAFVVEQGEGLYDRFDLASDDLAAFGSVGELPTVVGGPVLSRDGVFVVVGGGRPTEVRYRTESGRTGALGTEPEIEVESAQAAPDPLSGGVVIASTRTADPRRTELQVLGIDGTRRNLDTSDLPLRARISRVVTNETEALFVLADGSLVYAPLSGSAVRRLEPFTTTPMLAADVVLVDQGSAGGIAYVVAAGREFELRFRGLVCNR